MNEKNYNGWTNYETWLVKLWMDNSEYWEEEARSCMDDACPKEADAASLRNEARHDLAERIKESHESYVDEVMPRPAGFLNDLVNAALSEVNWDEIAAHYVDDIPVYAAGWNMPGYMPDSEPALFLDFDDARAYLADEIDRIADEDGVDEDDAAQLVDEVNEWKESGEHGLNFGSYFYWIVRQ